jgi:hypothetical protein
VQDVQELAQRAGRRQPFAVRQAGLGELSARQQPRPGERPGLDRVAVGRHEFGRGHRQREQLRQAGEDGELAPEARQRDGPAREAERPRLVHDEHGVVPALGERSYRETLQRGECGADQRSGLGRVPVPLGRPPGTARHAASLLSIARTEGPM